MLVGAASRRDIPAATPGTPGFKVMVGLVGEFAVTPTVDRAMCSLSLTLKVGG